jgi:hypothetical protein
VLQTSRFSAAGEKKRHVKYLQQLNLIFQKGDFDMANNEMGNMVVVVKQSESAAIGICALIFSIISIFFLAIVFIPLSLIFAIIAIIKKQFVWGIAAIMVACVSAFFSPTLWVALGIAASR